MQPLRILVVDDSLEFLRSATRFLSVDTGLEIVGRALSGREALEQVDLLRPDLVLMDLAMPGMNGLEATRHIKAQPCPPYVVILTLEDSVEYRDAAWAVGADGFLTKSDFGASLPDLLQSLSTYPSPKLMHNTITSTTMKQILLVDDSTTMRRMVMASLRGLPDVTFDEASSGLEALEHLAIAPIDLMILDLNMPDIHGLEVLKFVRSHATYQGIPIIVLTTRGDESSRNTVLNAGASVYLTKPFEPGILAKQVTNLLNQNKVV